MIEQIGSIERSAQHQAVLHVEHLLDVNDDLGRSGRRDAQYGHLREHGLQVAEELVVRPEVMAPAGAAVHLVDGEHAQFAGKVGLLECGQEAFALRQAFGCDVQQF